MKQNAKPISKGSIVRRVLIGSALVVSVPAFFGCSNPRGTPQVYPYATLEVPENSVTLINKQNFEDTDFKPNVWSSVSRVKFNGEELNLEQHENEIDTKPKVLEKIRKTEFPPTFMLPVENKREPIVSSDAITLPNGEILILGGTILPEGQKYLDPGDNSSRPTDYSWFFDPRTSKIRIGPRLTYPRRDANVIRLKDGRFLFTGGWCPSPFIKVPHAEIFDPKTNKFTSMPKMKVPRFQHSVAQLRNGNILIVGGQTTQNFSDAGDRLTSTIELLDIKKVKMTLVGQLRHARYYANVIPTGKNQAFICGGDSDETEGFDDHPYVPVQEAELYTGSETEVHPLKK
jgi:hypothetical protein